MFVFVVTHGVLATGNDKAIQLKANNGFSENQLPRLTGFEI
jgi:hypothetical protein